MSDGFAYSQSGFMVPSYVDRKVPRSIPLPENPNDIKSIYVKAGLTREGPWYGLRWRMPRDQSIDELDDTGLSPRDHILLYLMRQLEEVDGRFRFQSGDEAAVTICFEEWPDKDHTQERWDRFVRFVPPLKDSPQLERGT